jgi:hypothetical protein
MGANIGYYSILAKLLSPETHVIAIEGDKKYLPKIKANIKRNNVSGIEIVNRWVGQNQLSVKKLCSPLKNIELLSTDIQGAEVDVLNELASTGTIAKIERFLIGTHHVEKTHHPCLDILKKMHYKIILETEPRKVWQQPDGIIWAERTRKVKQTWKVF